MRHPPRRLSAHNGERLIRSPSRSIHAESSGETRIHAQAKGHTDSRCQPETPAKTRIFTCTPIPIPFDPHQAGPYRNKKLRVIRVLRGKILRSFAPSRFKNLLPALQSRRRADRGGAFRPGEGLVRRNRAAISGPRLKRNVVILRQRDSCLEIAEAMKQMFGVRCDESCPPGSRGKFNTFENLVGRHRKEAFEIAA